MTAKQFKRLRQRLGLTQLAFGKRLAFGTPQVRVSEIERGRVHVSKHVEELCKFLEQEFCRESQEVICGEGYPEDRRA